MRIAVIGSWNPEDVASWKLRGRDQFHVACEELGREIARHGHALVVTSGNQSTADYHVVKGVVTGGGSAPALRILRPTDRDHFFEEWQRQEPRLFRNLNLPSATQRNAKVFQIKESDAVVVLGGAETSYLAGIAAAVSGTRLIPVGVFGGAGERLNDLFSQSRGSWAHNVPDRSALGALNGYWTDAILNTVMELLRIRTGPQLLIVHGHSPDYIALNRHLQEDLKLAAPLVMREEFGAGRSLPEKLERIAVRADGAIALVTPDDVGGAATLSALTPLERRARENVWLEVGWFWGRLGRRSFMLLCRDQTVIPSDLRGIEYYEYGKDPTDRAKEINLFVTHLRDGKDATDDDIDL